MSRLLWVIPAYVAVFIGIYVFPSAWITLLGFHLAVTITLFSRFWLARLRFFAPVSPAFLLFMALAGFLGGAGLWLVWPYLGVSGHYRAQMAALGLTGDLDLNWVLFIGYVSLVNPWIEEAFWRGALTSRTRKPALVDFLYAGFHLIVMSRFVGPFWLLVGLLILAAIGWFWRITARLTGSLLPGVVCHIMGDFSIAWVLYLKLL